MTDAPARTSEQGPATRRRSLRRTFRHRYRRWRRRLRYGRGSTQARRAVWWGLGLLVVLSAVWLLVTALYARSQLDALQKRVGQVRALVAAGQVDDARNVAADIPAMARHAERLTTGPVWWTAAHVPYLGRPAQVVRETTRATADIGTVAVPELLDVARLIDPDSLRSSGDTVRLAPLVAAAPHLAHAAGVLDRATARIDALPGTWLGAIDRSRVHVGTALAGVRGYVDAAARVSRALPTMLGRDGPQRYFIALQNEAELRGTGGLPGAFAIAVTDHGSVHFTHFENDGVLMPAATKGFVRTGLSFGRDYDALYAASAPTSKYNDSNVSPTFPYAARIWAAMWQKVSGERVDGAIAVDPTALSYFLSAVGPTTADGRAVSAANVVPLTQRDAYTLYPRNAERKAFLVAVLRATATKITSGSGRGVRIVQAASLSSRQQRLQAWSRDPAVERVLEQTNFSGTFPDAQRPLAAPVLNNAAAGKLDYYLRRSMTYQRTGCGSRRDVVVTLRLTNTAPAHGLPPYVTTRLDRDPPKDAVPGDSRTLLDYYATHGALLENVTLDGKPSTAAAETIDGHAVFRFDLELPRGTTRTVVLHLNEPAGTGEPRLWRQPGVTALAVSAGSQRCG